MIAFLINLVNPKHTVFSTGRKFSYCVSQGGNNIFSLYFIIAAVVTNCIHFNVDSDKVYKL